MSLNPREMFEGAPFISSLGMTLVAFGEGRAESRMDIRASHLQQHGFIHAGVQATMADHTAGVAATSLLDADEQVLTIEFKSSFLRPAAGDLLVCRSQVLRRGRSVVFAESEVYAVKNGEEKLTAKASVTLAVSALRRGE